MSFIVANPFIDKVVLGLESTEQLLENIKAIDVEIGNHLRKQNIDFSIDPSKLIPSNWTK